MTITRNILKYSVLSGLFLVLFIPFLVPGAMFFPFITGKGFAFRILVEIIFGLYVIWAFIDFEMRPRMSWITKAVLVFTGAVLLADLFGVNVSKSLWSNYERMEGFVLIAHLAMYYIVASSVFNTKAKWLQYLNGSLVASGIMAIYAFFQIFGKVVINQGSTRVDATFGNATYFAIYLVFHVFFALYLVIDANKPKWQRWAYVVSAALNIIVLYFTATRGAILGLIGGLALAGLIIAFKEKENKLLRKFAYGALASVALVVIVFMSIKNTDFAKTNQVLGRFSSLGVAEIKSQGRYFVWPMAIEGFKENPILGWGQENFNFVFNKNYDARMYNQEQWFDRTHDIFLDWLIAGGLIGLLSYLSLYAALLYYIWKKQNFSLAEKSILIGLIAAYVFHNIFVFDNLVSYIFFFVLLGFVHTVSTMSGEPKTSKFYTKTFSPDSVNYIVTPVVLIAVVASVYFVNIPALFANRTLIQAISPQSDGGAEKNLELFKKVYSYNSFGSDEATEQLVQITSQISGSTGVPDNLKQQFYNLANEKIVEKVNRTPNDARYLVFAGSFFNRFGQYDEALKYLVRASIESPNKPGIYAEIGTSYLGKQDLNKMLESMKKAYDLAPQSKESQIIYAIGAIYAKNKTVLTELSTKIDQGTIIGDNRFLNAYANIGDYNTVVTILNTRLQTDPKNQQYRLSLASAYLNLGQKQKAIDTINQMIKDDPTFKEQGETYIKQIQNS